MFLNTSFSQTSYGYVKRDVQDMQINWAEVGQSIRNSLNSNNSYSNKDISCDELYSYVVSESGYPTKVSCNGSSMLLKVEKYSAVGVNFIVAYFKKSDYDYKGVPYIFCGVPSPNWSNFKSSGISGSWGEAFHEYIMDYTCNCE